MNKNVLHKIVLISLFATTFCFQSCYKDKFDFKNINDTIELSPHLGLPVAYGQVTLSNLVKVRKDTLELYQESQDVDTMIRLVYNIDTISKYKASTFLKPPRIDSISQSFQMPVIKIPDQKTGDSIKFADFLTGNFSTADYNYYNGIKTVTDVDSKTQSIVTSKNFNQFGNIKWVYTLTGEVYMYLLNRYDVPLTCDITIECSYTGYGFPNNTVGTFHFKDIQPQAIGVDSFNVNGVRISSNLQYKFTNANLGKYHTSIDMNKYLGMSIKLGNLSLTSGLAVVPPTLNNFTKQEKDTVISLETYKGKKLTVIDVYKGSLKFDMSTIQGMKVNLTINSIIKDGKPLIIATDNLQTKDTVFTQTIPLDGYRINLVNKDKNNKIHPNNSLSIHLSFDMDSKGKPISFNKNDIFKVKISNPDSLQFQYVEGNMGYDTLNLADKGTNGKNTFDFNIDQFIGNYFTGKVAFTDPKLLLNFTNSVGMPASTNLQLTGQTKSGLNTNLFEPPQWHDIIGSNDGADVTSNISIDKTHSNVVNFLANMPHSITASGQFITNCSNGILIDSTKIENKIWRDSYVSAQLHAELPLKLSMEDVVLRQDFNLSSGGNSSIESLGKDDQFKIIFYAKNQFPVDVSVKLTLIDSTQNKVLDTLDITIIKAAPTVEGKVARNVYTRHREEIVLSKDKNPNVVSNFLKANKLRFEAKLNTYNKQSVTIYTYYSISFQLGVDAKVKYKQSLNLKK